MNLGIRGDDAWRNALREIIAVGDPIKPRDQPTFELLHDQYELVIDMAEPVVTSPKRKLNYKFMCAEALWILSGDNKLEPLTRFVKRMAEFSDDGETLAGAYGPMVVPQLPYVTQALINDRDTRQAALTIWRPSPEPSKDIPCTIAMVFSIRDGLLHQHVFMRSSDAWLGVPYDMFSFACVGIKVACNYNASGALPRIGVGQLTITATSSHLYERDLEKVKAVLKTPRPGPINPLPDEVVRRGDWWAIERDLVNQREGYEAEVWKVNPRA